MTRLRLTASPRQAEDPSSLFELRRGKQRTERIVIRYWLLVIGRSAEGRHLNSEFGLRISDSRERGLHCQNLT